ncbi:MAG TPA: hypothetical protein DDW49_01310 [Deltaproteobacteria bacterium]|nr:hypothetical protein [Deltaproteobacteria bacterium]
MKMQEAGGHVQISNDAPSRLALDRTADLIPSIKKRFSRPLSPFSPRAGFRSLSPLGARIGINRFAPNFFRGR